MTSTPSRPMLRFHGGKWRLAPWIIDHFPQHDVYVEPFGGGGSVLLRKTRAYAEVYNDLDGEIVNLFRVARDQGEHLVRAIALTPYSRDEFDASFLSSSDPIEQARRTVVRSYMGFGGNLTRLTRGGRLERTGFRDYSKKNRRSIPAHDWRTWPQGLAALIDRLRGVIIENRSADAVMEKHDGPETLHYVDPPYVHCTRERGTRFRKGAYRYELTDDAHRAMAQRLHRLRGAVVLSGYDNALYRELFKDWRRVDVAAFADGARARTETLWISRS